ncbi:hypothetical protein [Nocardia stercoris]|uniref:Uncharacterized protein n=1 Tax=Nocardia stercoris TaxID=2483361 RepID=A0A3M2KT93_9NOCA|nr:hypothetical protein [Nocardia stercoris]RMI28679.1 hypothetical protein EBN03_28965 [Nocardia stercoris]
MASTSPFASFHGDAQSGALKVTMDPQGFVDIDKACEELSSQLVGAQIDARSIAEKSTWGLGENDARLTSANELVNMFIKKGSGGHNNAESTLKEYVTVVKDMQLMFKEIRDRFAAVDDNFAAELKRIQAK